MTSHSFHRSTAEERSAFVGFLEERVEANLRYRGPFYRLTC